MSSVAQLIFSRDLYEQVVFHAKRTQPREAVGILGGTAEGWITSAFALPNIAEGARNFLADPFAQYCALQQLKSVGSNLLAIYHSHPGGGVDPSEEDLEYAKNWPCAHLIISLGPHEDPCHRLRAFRCAGIRPVKLYDVPVSLF